MRDSAKNLFLAFIVLFSASVLAESSTLNERKKVITSMSETKPSEEQLERKNKSIEILKKQKVPYIDHLPVIEASSEVNFRTEEEVEWRALCLIVVAVKGEGLEQQVVNDLIEKYKLEGRFSPDEKAFIESANPSQKERVQFSWRYESAWVMLWALGFVDELEKPDKIADVPFVAKTLMSHSLESFFENAKLRSQSELLDNADLIYRYNWSVVDARVNQKDVPSNLESGVVYERHYSLNWLIGYMEQEWDDISTDT